MEKGIHYIENVFEYNDLLGVETLHPLVSVIDLSKDHQNNVSVRTCGNNSDTVFSLGVIIQCFELFKKFG